MDIAADEIAEIGEIIHAAAPEDCNIIFGVVFDENMGEELRITVIATGIEPVLAAQPLDLPGNATVTPFSNKESLQSSARRLAIPRPAEPRDEQRVADTRGLAFEPRTKRRGDFDLPTAERVPHRPGHEQFVFDEDNLEIPTFLRTQAD